MLTVTETKVEVVNREEVKVDLGDFLDTYVQQHNELAATFEWMKPQLDARRKAVWVFLLDHLKVVCRALDAGFDPYTPPKDWGHALVVNYVAPIPAEVRAALDVAIPIFGRGNVEIYDPNPEHFVKPRVIDPLALGSVALGERVLQFLIGKWDLPADLKFIEGQKQPHRDTGSLTNSIADLDALRNLRWVNGRVRLPDMEVGIDMVVRPFVPNPTGPNKATWAGIAHPNVAATRWAATMASSMGLSTAPAPGSAQSRPGLWA